MIRACDLMPQATAGLRPAPAPREPAGGTLNPSSWFDGDAMAAATRIGIELGFAGRGLSVAQHAERVLSHLCADPADRA
jgi:hypothetical protein